MNQITIFKSEEFGELRSMNIEGEAWFVGKDVAMVLGYANANDALRKHVETEDKGGSKMRYPWRNTVYDHHQRVRPLRSHPVE